MVGRYTGSRKHLLKEVIGRRDATGV